MSSLRHGRGTRRFARLWQSPRTTRLSAPHRYVGSLSRFVCLGRAPAARALFVAARASAKMRRSTATARVAFARSFSSPSGSMRVFARTFGLLHASSMPPLSGSVWHHHARRQHGVHLVRIGRWRSHLVRPQPHSVTDARTHAHTPFHSPTPVFARAGRAPSEGPRNRRNATVCFCGLLLLV